MPRGEATREGIESLMASTAKVEVVRDSEGEYIQSYLDGRTNEKRYGVVPQKKRRKRSAKYGR